MPARKYTQKLWRAYVYCRFLLIDRWRHGKLVLESIEGKPFLILPDVFNPKLFHTGEFMMGHLDSQKVAPGARVLDMGTGSGIGAVAASRWAGQVVAVDKNPSAVRCARINVLLNRVEQRVEVREGDLFAPVEDESFDVVLFNPPFFSGRPQDRLEAAFRSDDIAERFAAELAGHLRPAGHALIVLSSHGQERRFVEALRGQGFELGVVAERDLHSEVLSLYIARRKL